MPLEITIRTLIRLALVLALLLPSATAAKRAPRMAVFELELRNVKLKSSMARILRDYLSDTIAATGAYRVVPGDKLRSALRREQLKSRMDCFKKSCQRRIGEALSADYSLSTRVMRIGKTCTVTSIPWNLETKVADKGAKAEGGCGEEHIKRAIDAVVRQLAGPATSTGGGPGPGRSDLTIESTDITRPTARLIMQVKPRSARVKVTGPGGYSSTGPWDWERKGLKPGTYKVVAGVRDYLNTHRQVTLEGDDIKTLQITLERPGALVISGTPKGSRVDISGPGDIALVKGLPLTIKGAPLGTYTVKVSRQGYQSEEQQAQVRPGATTRVEVRLKKDRAGWVLIPGGTYRMGSTAGKAREKPAHTVRVSSFYLGKSEVTVAQYRACVSAGKCSAAHVNDGTCYVFQGGSWKKGTLPPSFQGDHQPVVCVDWTQARKYCSWAGGRLPSEAEWEYAARSGGHGRQYPWGDEEATCGRAVMNDGGYGCGKNQTWPVCRKTAGNTVQGLCDMAGNVWEWAEDCWHKDYSGAPSDGTAWTASCKRRVLRGGSWSDDATYLRAAARFGFTPAYRCYIIGFRCAMTKN